MTTGSLNSRSNKFDALELIECELEMEAESAVDVVQEIVEIIVDSGVANSVWPNRKKGVTRTKADEKAETGGKR